MNTTVMCYSLIVVKESFQYGALHLLYCLGLVLRKPFKGAWLSAFSACLLGNCSVKYLGRLDPLQPLEAHLNAFHYRHLNLFAIRFLAVAKR